MQQFRTPDGKKMSLGEGSGLERPDTNRQMQRGREGRGDILGRERSWEDGLRDVLWGQQTG